LLLFFFNIIWRIGTLPLAWKRGIIIPILKADKDPTIPSNYRPIAMTSCFCESFERMLSTRLTWYLEKNLLSPYLSGFRGKSKHFGSVSYHGNQYLQSLSKRISFIFIFLDFHIAYGMQWKDGLLLKLNVCMGACIPT